jgi:hypothetical protein
MRSVQITRRDTQRNLDRIYSALLVFGYVCEIETQAHGYHSRAMAWLRETLWKSGRRYRPNLHETVERARD